MHDVRWKTGDGRLKGTGGLFYSMACTVSGSCGKSVGEMNIHSQPQTPETVYQGAHKSFRRKSQLTTVPVWSPLSHLYMKVMPVCLSSSPPWDSVLTHTQHPQSPTTAHCSPHPSLLCSGRRWPALLTARCSPLTAHRAH